MKFNTAIIWMLAMLAAVAAKGQPTIFFGEEVSPYNNGTNNVPRPAVMTNTLEAAASFAAHLPGVIAQSFEAYPTGSSPTTIAFGANLATLSGTRQIVTVADPTTTFNGVFPITGTNALLLSASKSGFFALDFTSPQAAFGFFGTDIELAGLSLGFIATNGLRTEIDIPVTRPQASGGVFFFGVINKTAPFTRIEFSRVGTSDDGFGFDDFTIATPEQVAPPQLSIRLSEVELSWPTLTNESYNVQYKTNLTGGVWNVLQCVAGDGTIKRIYDRIAVNEPRRFYRLVITNCVP